MAPRARILIFCNSRNYEGKDGRDPVPEVNGLYFFQNSTSIPGKQALPVGRSDEFYRSRGLDLWQEFKT